MTNTTNTTIRTATWENVGTDIAKAKKIQDALRMANLDYNVVKAPIFLSNGIKVPGKVATIVEGTDRVLGVVGSKYEIVQNREAFDFVDSIIPEGLQFVKAGETKKMQYIIAKLPSTYVLGDEFTQYVILQNSFNGSSNLKATICPLRIVCQNQFNISFKGSTNKISLRHSKSIKGKLAEGQMMLQAVAEYMKDFNSNMEKMAKQKVNKATVEKILDSYFVVDDDATERKEDSIREHRQLFLNAYNAEDNQNFTGTVYGMVNAFSDYITHLEPARETKNGAENRFVKVTLKDRLYNEFLNTIKANA